jgi:DNA invertase Pin-like site-specific DNA recombinase
MEAEGIEYRVTGYPGTSRAKNPAISLTPMDRAMFHIAGAFAELEREIIRERVNVGLQSARSRGKRLGRRKAMGHQPSRRSVRRPPGGLSGRAIAKTVGVSEATVRRILQNRVVATNAPEAALVGIPCA